jgi:hypothetical protein
VPDKDAKTRAGKAEEISKQENCKISQTHSTKKKYIFCRAKVRAALTDNRITFVTLQCGKKSRSF